MHTAKRGVNKTMKNSDTKGLSDIVSSVLLIVLGIVAVAILWGFVAGILRSNANSAEDNAKNLLDLLDQQSPPLQELDDDGSGGDIVNVNFDSCGNGLRDPLREQCDDACLLGTPSICEEVDNGDGCSSECTTLTCEQLGGFSCQSGEACFGNSLNSADSSLCCDVACIVPTGQVCNECEGGLTDSCSKDECAGILEGCYYDYEIGGEDCKSCNDIDSCGDFSSNSTCEQSSCNLNCQWNNNACEKKPVVCGDGFKDPEEFCEEGDVNGCVAPGGYSGTNSCANCIGWSVDCVTTERCSDGVKNGNEECDDGDTREGDGCSSICIFESVVCGNGANQTGEVCDFNDAETQRSYWNCDDNLSTHWGYQECLNTCDGYGSSCTVTLYCGDSTCTDQFENTASCPQDCAVCGDNICSIGEDCTSCSDCACSQPGCGDGNLDLGEGEECDDGNLNNGDGCSSQCTTEPAGICGNGIVEWDEVCDGDRLEGDFDDDPSTHRGYQDCMNVENNGNIDLSGNIQDNIFNNDGSNLGSFIEILLNTGCDRYGEYHVILYCGDNRCSQLYETCKSCSQDCGPCTPQCSDGRDNDLDSYIDYPADFGCQDISDNSEINDGTTQCSDGIDNDGDTKIDQVDLDCSNKDDNTEACVVTSWSGCSCTPSACSGCSGVKTSNCGTTLSCTRSATGCGSGKHCSGGSCVPNSGSCFLGDTAISTPSGDKEIKDIREGDLVFSYNEETDEIEESKVTQTFEHKATGYWIINNKVKVTPNHRMLINGEWQEIGNAKIGDELKTIDGEEIIYSIVIANENVPVYNFKVEKNHNYFAESYLAHNDKGGPG